MLKLPRGTVTFLFTDIEGSTRLLHELGESYAHVLTEHRRILREAFERHRGREVDTQGDSFFVAFSDHRDAVDAAIASQTALASQGWPDGAAVRVRMGIHTGEPLVADEHYVGLDVHRAARIAAAAHGGQVLVSDRTQGLLADGARPDAILRELGSHPLKDLPEPERLFQLVVAGLPSTFPPPRVHEQTPAAAGLPDYSLPPAEVPCPYKGLESFEREDSEIFFGREELVATLVARLEEVPFLALVGPSGSGKSSLARAGVVPELERRGALPIIFNPGEHPVRELSLAAQFELPGEAVEGVESDRGARLLVVDQFEEVFTLCRDEEERQRFITALLDASRSDDANVRVVLALRADFYGHCALYPELASALEEHQALVGPMTEEELRRAIERPAERAGLVLEPGLVEGILRDVVGEPGALPLLSHSLLETWRRRSGRMLTLVGYLQCGGVQGAIAKTAETVFREQLTPKQQVLARNAFLRLTELGEATEDTRRRVHPAELVPREEEAAEVDAVLRVLADARLVTIGERTVEVAHEALIRHWPTLRSWLDEDREGRLVHRRLTEAAQDWEALGKELGALYRGTRLAGATEWAESHDSELNELEREFLAASRKVELGEIEATRRRSRRLGVLVAALAIFLVVAIAAGGLAFFQRQEARSAATSAEAQRLGAQALVQKDLDISLLLAREGVNLDDSLVTQGNLLAALVRSPAAIGVLRPLPGRLLFVDATPDGRFVGVQNNNRQVAFIDTHTRRTIRTHEAAFFLFASDGRSVALGQTEPLKFVIVDIASGKPRKTIPLPANVQAFHLTEDLMRLATVSPTGVAIVRDTATGRIVRRVRVPKERHLYDVFLQGPRRLLTIEATGSPETSSTVRELWDVETGRLLGSVKTQAPAPAPYAVSPDASKIAVGDGDGSVLVYDLISGKRRQLHGRHNARVSGIAFGPGNRLVSTGDDKQVIVWNLASARIEETLSGHNGRVLGAAFSPDGATLYTVSLDGSLMIWDLSGKRRLGRRFVAGAGHPPEFTPETVALSQSGERVAITQGDGQVVIRGATSLREIRRIPAVDGGAVLAAAFSPDGGRLATAGVGGEVAVWDVATGAPIHRRLAGPPPTRGGSPNAVAAIGFTPDGRTIVAGDGWLRLYFWDARSGAPVQQPLEVPRDPALRGRPDEDRVYGLAVNSAGNLIAVGHGSKASVWELPSRTFRYTVDVDKGYGLADALAFSPDDSLLATGGGIGEVRFWNAATGAKEGRSITASAGWVNSLVFDPTGRIVVSGGTDGTTRLLDVESRTVIGAPLPGLDNTHQNALLTPDGHRVIVVYDTGGGFVWDIRPSVWTAHACGVARRNLTGDEWEQFLPDRDYRPVCPGR